MLFNRTPLGAKSYRFKNEALKAPGVVMGELSVLRVRRRTHQRLALAVSGLSKQHGG